MSDAKPESPRATTADLIAFREVLKIDTSKQSAMHFWSFVLKWLVLVGPILPIVSMSITDPPEWLLHISTGAAIMAVLLIFMFSMLFWMLNCLYLFMLAIRPGETDPADHRGANNLIASLTVTLGLVRTTRFRTHVFIACHFIGAAALFAAACHFSAVFLVLIVLGTRMGRITCQAFGDTWLNSLSAREVARLIHRPWETKDTSEVQ